MLKSFLYLLPSLFPCIITYMDKQQDTRFSSRRLCAGAILLLCLCLFSGGCTKKEELRSRDVIAMDTYMTIKIYGGSDGLLEEAEKKIKTIESLVSVTDPNSEISKLNRDKQAEVSSITADIINKAIDMCEKTGGNLNIALYPIVKAWGFTTDAYHIPSEEELQKLLNHTDYTKIQTQDSLITLEEYMEIDLGSVAKGYSADLLCDYFQKAGISSAILDLGGNIQTIGRKPDNTLWHIGIQSPLSSDLLGIVEVENEAVVTSGGYERYFEDEEGNIYWHIMDPANGYPARNGLISVTVVHESGFLSDALSTSLFVMGKEKAIAFWRAHKDFEMILLSEDNELFITPALHQQFTIDASFTGSLQEIPND